MPHHEALFQRLLSLWSIQRVEIPEGIDRDNISYYEVT